MAKTNKILQEIRNELASTLLFDFKKSEPVREINIEKNSVWQMLIEELAPQVAKEIKKELREEDLLKDKKIVINNKNTEKGLIKAEEKLEKVMRKLGGEQAEDEDEDEIKGTGSNYPNLKYAKPKYKNMESVLKYIESKDDNGGVKLIIMNFND